MDDTRKDLADIEDALDLIDEAVQKLTDNELVDSRTAMKAHELLACLTALWDQRRWEEKRRTK